MKCTNPFVNSAGQAFGCGQCLPCLFNRRRIWTHRIMLEALQHPDNAFVTLTYEDDELTLVDGRSTLVPSDLQNWLKSFRKALEPLRIRFYGVGEYGDKTERPHYHVAVFGFPTCFRGRTRRRFPGSNGPPLWRGCCASCELVGKTWGRGDVDLGILEVDSAQYVAQYVTKKMTSRDDARLFGRHPEFARMSNRPGIGQSAMWDVASQLMKFDLDLSEADVPSALLHGKRPLPLGRYLRMQLRKMVGKDEKTPSEIQKALSAELLPLREAARLSSDAPSLRDQIVLANKGAVARMEARAKIFKGRKSL